MDCPYYGGMDVYLASNKATILCKNKGNHSMYRPQADNVEKSFCSGD